MDNTEAGEIALAKSRIQVKRLIKNGLILKDNVKVHSKFRARLRQQEKRDGRHMGKGKRRGTKNARMPSKVLWMRRQRVLRRLLRKYRKMQKIDKKLYSSFYKFAKGNQFKNKKVLIETIQKEKAERLRQEKLINQQEQRRKINQKKRENKLKKKQRMQKE